MDVLSRRYNVSQTEAVKIFVKWPGILNVVNISGPLDKLEGSLRKLQLPFDSYFMSKLIRSVPRVIVQDIVKKCDSISKCYPTWNLREIVTKNPRILTQKNEIIRKRFRVSLLMLVCYLLPLSLPNYFFVFILVAQDLADALGQDIDAVAVLNNSPTVLLRDPVALASNIRQIARYLPSCSANELAVKSEFKKKITVLRII